MTVVLRDGRRDSISAENLKRYHRGKKIAKLIIFEIKLAFS